jgi:hypothetical protein
MGSAGQADTPSWTLILDPYGSRLMCLFLVLGARGETHETFRRESGMRYDSNHNI